MIAYRARVLACFAVGLFPCAQAMAQETPLDAVTERERTQHATEGMRIGSFRLDPSADAALAYSDNIYAVDTGKQDDLVATTEARLNLDSDFSRNALSGKAYVSRQSYVTHTTEDATTYGGQIAGRYEIGSHTAIDATGAYDHLVESRSQLNSNRLSDRRIGYDSWLGRLGVSHDFVNLRVNAFGRYQKYEYDTATVGGVPEDQSFRNFGVAEGTLELLYGIQDLTRFVVRGTVEHRRYDLRPGDPGFDPVTMLDRSADGYRIEGGIQRSVTNLIQATLRVGYMHYNYADTRLRDISAFSYHADAVWNITPLTSLNLIVDRRVDETISPLFSGNLRDEGRVVLKHELLRDLVLSGDVRYAYIRLLGSDTRSRELETGLGANYYIGRHLLLDLDLRHNQRLSNDDTIRFTANMATLGVRYTF